MNTTDRLMNILHETDSVHELNGFINDLKNKEISSFQEYFLSLEKVKLLSNKEIINLSGIDKSYYYQIIDGRRHPGRDKLIALALATKIGLNETQRCLEICSLAPLYSRNRRDAILIYAVTHDLTTIEANELLDEFGENLLQ